jgi:hypothetical protein
MAQEIHLLDVVAMTEDLNDRGLFRGQVGTVVEALAPGVFELEPETKLTVCASIGTLSAGER